MRGINLRRIFNIVVVIVMVYIVDQEVENEEKEKFGKYWFMDRSRGGIGWGAFLQNCATTKPLSRSSSSQLAAAAGIFSSNCKQSCSSTRLGQDISATPLGITFVIGRKIFRHLVFFGSIFLCQILWQISLWGKKWKDKKCWSRLFRNLCPGFCPNSLVWSQQPARSRLFLQLITSAS